MKVSVTKVFKFEAAHHLPNYLGKCSRVHGHTYKLEVEIEGEIDETSGMVVDFKNLKTFVESRILKTLDHSNLNDSYENPTAEVMVKGIFQSLIGFLQSDNEVWGVKLVRVRLWETSDSYAEVKV
jgi:6-pyruvoyltetrahydropterin/6-carboxytetrahydropterin synthase